MSCATRKRATRWPSHCTASVNGQAVPVRAVRTPEPPQQAHGPHPWTWFEFNVPAGNHSIGLTINPAKPEASFFRGEVGWWLWAEHPLTRATLTVEYKQPVPAAEPLPLAISIETERQIITVQPTRLLRVGNRWPKSDRPVVYLDETAPDESSQEWGHLERNRSVWQKEMIIAGQPQRRGLGTHANSRIVYELSGGGFKRLRAVVGRDEHAGDGTIVFQVWLDGQCRFDSGPMTNATPGKPVEVDVAGAEVSGTPHSGRRRRHQRRPRQLGRCAAAALVSFPVANFPAPFLVVQGGYPAPPPRPPLRLSGPVQWSPSSARIEPGNARVSCCERVLRAGFRRPAFRSRMGMRMKRPHDQMIRPQRRIGKGKAAAHAGRSPSRYDGRCRKFHVDPATFLVSVVWVVGKRIARASSIACLTPRCARSSEAVGGRVGGVFILPSSLPLVRRRANRVYCRERPRHRAAAKRPRF